MKMTDISPGSLVCYRDSVAVEVDSISVWLNGVSISFVKGSAVRVNFVLVETDLPETVQFTEHLFRELTYDEWKMYENSRAV